MVTLTYRPGCLWRRCHVSRFLDHLRAWATRKGFVVPYVWVAELQKRGAVHYHVIAWLPSRVMMPKPDKRGWWGHGMSQVIRARNAIGYLTKYVSKGDGVERIPRHLRLFGGGGAGVEARAVRWWLCAPSWLHQQAKVFQRFVRLPGGILVSECTGEEFRSPWVFVRFDSDTERAVFRSREFFGGV